MIPMPGQVRFRPRVGRRYVAQIRERFRRTALRHVPTQSIAIMCSTRSVARDGALGLHGITVEEEFGGSGLGYLEHCVAMEEISRPVQRSDYLRRAFKLVRQPASPQR